MHTFPKIEKLKSEKAIARLFKSGKTVMAYPLRAVWDFNTNKTDKEGNKTIAVQAGFSVPKRRFKKAVTRNLIKRRIREAYRLNKSPLLLSCKDRPIQIMVLFVGKEILEYREIEKGVLKMIKKMEIALESNT